MEIKKNTSNFEKYRKIATIITTIVFVLGSLTLTHMRSDSFNPGYIVFPIFAGIYGLMSYAFIWSSIWDETDYLTHR